MGRVLQSLDGWPKVLLVWVGCLGIVLAKDGPDWSPRLDHPAVRHTALLAVAFWAAGVGLLLRLTADEWADGSDRRGELRAVWAAGWLVFAAHVAAAFHLGHGWSHAAAFDHTERTAGVGEGVFVNYLFGLVWGLDAVWLAGWPDRYARRPRWVGWAAHGFLTFITFNATVVYGTGLARWVGVVVFVGLGWLLVRRRHGS